MVLALEEFSHIGEPKAQQSAELIYGAAGTIGEGDQVHRFWPAQLPPSLSKVHLSLLCCFHVFYISMDAMFPRSSAD